jgi:hypothetical protein
VAKYTLMMNLTLIMNDSHNMCKNDVTAKLKRNTCLSLLVINVENETPNQFHKDLKATKKVNEVFKIIT